jgi:hypothetical protein
MNRTEMYRRLRAHAEAWSHEPDHQPRYLGS